MNIGIVSSFIDEKSGGIGVYTENLVKKLNEIDFHNNYFLIHYARSTRDIYLDNSEIIIPQKSFLNHMPGSYSFWRYYTLPKELKKYKLDVIHDPYELGPLSFSNPAAKIITIHDLTPLLFPEHFKSADVWLHRLLFSKTIKNVDKIITVSEYSKKDIIEHINAPEDKIEVVYNGKSEIFHPHPEAELEEIKKRYNIPYEFILCVGGLHPIKNIPRLLKAYKKVLENGYRQPLVIVGKKVDKWDPIFHTISQLGLEDRVIFTGHINDNDLSLLYSAAQVFVYPCLYAGFGLPPLEAMACGTPVISSNNSSIPEVVGDAGILIDPYQVYDIATAMVHVMDDESMQKKMIKKGKKQAKLFSWDNAARETLNIYKEAYESHI